jgi:hypothetical protein
MIKDKVLLVGNGINSIKTAYSWKRLINDLISYVGAVGQIKIKDKPFPLLYEEILFEGVRNKVIKEEEDLKKNIADEVTQIKPNDIHEQVMNSEYENILTTNYEYTLELSQGLQQADLKNVGVVKEKTYSLFRKTKVKDTQIWHIHGECNSSRTITLGYEHYGGYLQQMRNYAQTGIWKSAKKPLGPMSKRLKKRSFKPYSWIDFFFTKNIYIIGFTLDFVEMHLWWLLTYRARRKIIDKARINNKIYYFYPDSIAGDITNKLQLLKSNEVISLSTRVKNGDMRDYYEKVLNKIKRFP